MFNLVEELHRKSQLWNSSSQPLESLQKFTLSYLTLGLAVLRPTYSKTFDGAYISPNPSTPATLLSQSSMVKYGAVQHEAKQKITQAASPRGNSYKKGL